MKLVAVSQNVEVLINRNERRDTLDQNIVNFLLACGFLTFPVPNTLNKFSSVDETTNFLDIFLNEMKPHAFLLSGGNNIGECPERDETEFAIISYAEKKRLPLLGICRGMQIMSLKAGVKPIPIASHAGTRHQIRGEIWGEVNSFHKFCIPDCPDDYLVVSKSDDAAIEAIKHRELPWEAWMWHPEREFNFVKRDVKRVKALFNN